MQNSVFAKIVSGEIPCHKVYEDDMTLAFMDVYPKNDGHVLVIPKVRPTEFIWDLDDDVYQAVMATAKKIALRLREVMPDPYVHQAVVGTDVPYTHVHLIPFTTTKDLHGRQDFDADPDHETLAKLAGKIRF